MSKLITHTLKMDSKNFTYYTIGKGEPIVLIAGLGADKTIWNNLIELLNNHFEIIFFDNKGTGTNKNFASPTNTKEMADDVIKILDQLNLDHVNILGHSLGSYVAQHMAVKLQNRIKKLILVSTRAKASINSILHYDVIMKLLRLGVEREILVRDSLSWLYGSHYLQNKKKSDAIIETIIKNPPVCSLKNLFNQINAVVLHDSTQFIKKINNDTLIIHGALDLLFTQNEAFEVANAIINSQFVLLKEIGHMVPIEAPHELSKLIKNFCLNHSR